MLRDLIHKWIAKKYFKNSDLAAHSIKFAGKVAGRVDGYNNGRIRGWIYDARRPNDPVKLMLWVNNLPVREFVANVYRKDIANLSKDNGMNGFEIDVRKHLDVKGTPAKIKIELLGESQYNFEFVIAVDFSNQAVNRELEIWDGGSSGLKDGSIDDKLGHIFDHITATFENNRNRLEKLQKSYEGMASAAQRGGT